MKLDGKVAIVTGAGAGIGRAVARRLAADGARVVVADIDRESATSVAEEITARSGKAVDVHCDVSKKLDLTNLLAATTDAFGRVDALVNNAGIIRSADFLDVTEDDFDAVLAVNLRAAFILSQMVARRMIAQAKEAGERRANGAIVNMSSVNAVLAIPNQTPYAVSKGGLNQLTKVAALSLAPHGIRVNAIGPGSILTEMVKTVMTDEAAKTRIMSRTPMGRLGEPDEIASIASFLISDDSSYMTGQCLYADGGRLGLNYTMPVEA